MRACALLVMLALAACDREPSFDERYEAAEHEIRTKASELNEDLSEAPESSVPADRASELAPPAD